MESPRNTFWEKADDKGFTKTPKMISSRKDNLRKVLRQPKK